MFDKQLLLSQGFTGEIYTDKLHRVIYATDASVYSIQPLAVVYPKNQEDIVRLVIFAREHHINLIPRSGGTSLAGQCVGKGIVVDVSRHMTALQNLDVSQRQVTVQPGIIRDELNTLLREHQLMFGPDTSTSNRCTIGGMVGNNSSGSTSIQYGVTRDKVVALTAVLSDGTVVTFQEMPTQQFLLKAQGNSLEANIYRQIIAELTNTKQQQEIKQNFPKQKIHRRCTGYAVDSLLSADIFGGEQTTINVAKLIAGSEGTLCFITSITVQLDELPPPESVMITAHFNSIGQSLQATLVAMQHQLYTCELMDKAILDCTKNNREQRKNRFFLQGDPAAVLMLEVRANSKQEVEQLADALIVDLKQQKYGYHYPKVYSKDIVKVHQLRKAGLGVLGNMIGDDKAVACIEDTAVALEDLPQYIAEFTEIMARYQQQAIYYAHAGAGELHLRPILNLKKQSNVSLFRKITTETAQLVKKYHGSFSGEHGDGIVRAEFIPLMIGEKNYQLLKRIKHSFDSANIFNRGKIIDPLIMDQNLRYEVDRKEPVIATLQDFSDSQGILRIAEKCNGSGDCRKLTGGAMCPSYRATRQEKDTTRARANALRSFLTNSTKTNRFNHQELKEVFDLCLSCKACATECPSNVDIAALKTEFLYQYQRENGVSLRNHLFAYNAKYNKVNRWFAPWVNFIGNLTWTKKLLGIAPQRNLPKIQRESLVHWLKKQSLQPQTKKVYLFVDEFTNYYDTNIGKDAVNLLTKLGYQVLLLDHEESGRSALSKGMLPYAKYCANYNVNLFKNHVNEIIPLVGIEPSAILTFRDEYLRLADDTMAAKKLAQHSYTFDEFIAHEVAKNHITGNSFTTEHKVIKIHQHCHQKALSQVKSIFTMLNLPQNYQATIMATGCCGMAGSFGYEAEHYDVSMQVGEDTLFQQLRQCSQQIEIAAAGTSCRHQIYDGLSRKAKHPITILYEALIN